MSQSKHTPEPLDCPCGSARLPDVMKSIANQYRVRCICGRAGPFSLSRLEAIAGWNRQTAAPDLLEALRKAAQDLRSVAIWADEHGMLSVSWINDKANDIDAAIATAEEK